MHFRRLEDALDMLVRASFRDRLGGALVSFLGYFAPHEVCATHRTLDDDDDDDDRQHNDAER